ncbi:MAG: SH3 domain-containing protein, partial [Clostridiales bacterium]|nr:SH3 domain-containing protein [Clostridiales bacterium]
MSREYARRSKGGGNLPLIIAIVGTVIVIAVIVYFFFLRPSASLGAQPSDAPIITAPPTMQVTFTPGLTPTISPVVTIAPLVTPTVAPIVQNTSTPTPVKTYPSATVYATSLNVREGPGLNYTTIGTVKYGEQYKVHEETSKWIKIQLSSGAYGWVWEGYTARGNDPVPPRATPAPADAYVKSATLNGTTTITITFDSNAYSSSAKSLSEIIPISAFVAKEGGVNRVTAFASGGTCAGGTGVTLQLSGYLGGELKLTVDGDKIYDTDGKDTGDFSKTFNAGADVTDPTVTNKSLALKVVTFTFSESIGSAIDGTGSLDASDFVLTGQYTATIDSASSSGSTATITISFTGMSSTDTS